MSFFLNFRAVCSVLSSLFFPLIPWCLKCGVVIWVLFIAFHLFSIGTQIYKAYGMDVMCKCNDKYEVFNSSFRIYIYQFLLFVTSKMCHFVIY